MTQRVDPIALEIIRHSLASIADELEVDITRTAYSPLIYEYRDYAVGLLTPTGSLITHAEMGPLIFTTDLERPLTDSLECLAQDGVVLGEGDVVLNNFAGITGQHLNNVNAYSPAYYEGELVGWAAIRMHWADVGGKEPGSSAANDSNSIFQEGINLRAIRVMTSGAWNPEVLRLVEWNTRLPEQVLGDLRSQVFAALKGARLLSMLAERHGRVELMRAVGQIWDESERLARAALEALPDGVFEADSCLDDDGVGGDPVMIPIVVTIAGGEMTVDFRRISDQLSGPFNSGNGAATTARAAYRFIIGEGRRSDAGVYRPLHVVSRRGSFLTAEWPAPMARWSAALPTVVDTIIRAIAPAAPERAAAGHHGSTGAYYFFGFDESGKYYKHMDAALGGWGALVDGDGPGPYKTLTHGDSADIPIEVVERTYPLEVRSYAFRQGSAGDGKWRGGLGTEKRIRTTKPVLFSCMFDRSKCPAWGLDGGGNGEPGGVLLQLPGEAVASLVRKVTSVSLPANTDVTVLSAGGGGWGPPDERAEGLRARDRRLGWE